jgi:hypothetical protein
MSVKLIISVVVVSLTLVSSVCVDKTVVTTDETCSRTSFVRYTSQVKNVTKLTFYCQQRGPIRITFCDSSIRNFVSAGSQMGGKVLIMRNGLELYKPVNINNCGSIQNFFDSVEYTAAIHYQFNNLKIISTKPNNSCGFYMLGSNQITEKGGGYLFDNMLNREPGLLKFQEFDIYLNGTITRLKNGKYVKVCQRDWLTILPNDGNYCEYIYPPSIYYSSTQKSYYLITPNQENLSYVGLLIDSDT